jgi:hypothetical protein
MRQLFRTLCMFAAVLLAPLAQAAEPIAVTGAWARATAGGQKVGAAYLELAAPAGTALVAAETPVSARVELHTMSMEGGVMKMRPVEKIEVPAAGRVSLKPGGLHLMLIDLKQPLKEGTRVPLTLTFQSGAAKTTVSIEAEVRPLSGAAPAQHKH